MNITSKVWNFTKTGAKAHCFGEDGTALCRSSIKAPATQMMTKEEARKTVLSGPGLSFCETCEGKFQSILNVEAFDTLEAEEAPAAPVLKIAKVKPEIAPEVIEALAWLRKGWDGDNSERAIMALGTLDNAGVFAAIDDAARYGAAPAHTEVQTGSDEWHRLMGEALAQTPLYAPRVVAIDAAAHYGATPAPECTCPASRVSFPGDLSGIHTEGCPAAPAPLDTCPAETVQCGHCNGDYKPKADGTLRKHACWKYDQGLKTTIYGPLDIHDRAAKVEQQARETRIRKAANLKF